MSTIDCDYSALWESVHGQAVSISFRGFYPHGSLENRHERLREETMLIAFDPYLIARFDEAIVANRPLAPLGGKWGEEEIKAAAVVL
jgi:hypothetical protein